MPFLNAGSFIEEAIESVRAQTIADWELLLVDDGSTDRSSAVARRYAEHDPDRVRLLHHEAYAHRGTTEARNLALRKARGSYIAFLDADDVFLPERLEKHVRVLSARADVDVVVSEELYWFSWEDSTQRDWKERHLFLDNTVVNAPDYLIAMLNDAGRSYPSICSITFRRSIIHEIGLFDPYFRDVYEDQAFFNKIFLQKTVFIMTVILAKYRRHAGSTSYRLIGGGRDEPGQPEAPKYRFLIWLQHFLLAQGVTDARIWRALEREIWWYHHPAIFRTFKRLRCGRQRLQRGVSDILRAILPQAVYVAVRRGYRGMARRSS